MMLSIVIPTLNENDNIGRLVSEIRKKVEVPFEIIIIDDGSTDGTIGTIRKLQKSMGKRLRLIQRKERGLGGAMSKGLQAAKGEFIATMDADLSHDPIDIRGMLKAIEGNDVVVGSRYLKGAKVQKITWKRLIISKGANYLTKIFLGLTPSDLTNNFRLYRRSSLKEIHLGKIRNKSFSFLVEVLYLLARKGCKMVEFPIHFREREDGLSKLSKSQYVMFAKTIARLKLSEIG
ncbi:MAG: polyprenol monophosphomannose synthase [Candidatus Micrarchaeota archaeon]